jgi:hypothetical protein
LPRIVAAYTINQLGWWFALVALSLGVYNHTHSPLAVAAVFDAGVVPALLASVVVARVEASPRRGGLSILYAVEAACSVGLALVLWQFSLVAILALVAIDGSVAYAARALVRSEAARAGQATTSPYKRRLDAAPDYDGTHRANAALNVSLAVCSVSGPALAGLAVRGLGAPSALLVDGVGFLISGLLLLDLRPHVEEATASVRRRVADARTYLRRTRALRALIATQAVALVFFLSAIPVEVAYATHSLHAGDLGYGLLLASWGVGQVAGSVLFARAGRLIWAMLSLGTLAVGLAYVGMAIAPTLAVACLAALPGGIGNGVQWAAFIGIVQQLTPSRLLGRVMGVAESVGAVAPVIGYSLGGLLALASPRIALFSAGLAASATTLSFARIARLKSRSAETSDLAEGDGRESSQPESDMQRVAS